MLPRHHEPIVAIATAPGRGGVGIVRDSGRGLAPLARALCGRDLAVVGALDAHIGLPLDLLDEVVTAGRYDGLFGDSGHGELGAGVRFERTL